MIFIIRCVSAFCLFSFLARANIWLNPINNIMLVVGYRFFLILTPIINRYIGKHAGSVAFLFSAFGCLMWTSDKSIFNFLGSIAVGTGLSVGGYLIKSQAAETARGAGLNKIALNVGSLAAGGILSISMLNNPNTFYISGCIILFICSFLSWNSIRNNSIQTSSKTNEQIYLHRKIAWSLIGISIGIKLFGIFSILPQVILKSTEALPVWYGFMISLNSLVIIIFQIPLIKKLDALKNPQRLVTVLLGCGMLILALPQVFYIHFFIGAFMWTLICSLIECCASYLDVSASRDRCLLYKEASVGLGAALTVAIMRNNNPEIGALIIGFIGLISLISGVILLKNRKETLVLQSN
jgi:hypothetical protein